MFTSRGGGLGAGPTQHGKGGGGGRRLGLEPAPCRKLSAKCTYFTSKIAYIKRSI
jgi:hypothetical protein